MPLEDVLKAIKEFALQHLGYSFIITIENKLEGKPQQAVFARQLVNILGDLIYQTPVEELDQLPSPEELRKNGKKIIIRGKKIKISSTEESLSQSDDDKSLQLFNSCINICQSKSLKKLADILQEDRKFNYSFSIPEVNALKMVDESKTDLIELSSKQLIKVYPKGTRIDSSNASPFPFWSAGIQIVAVNYQDPSIEMRLYRGFFRQNGNCGYVLKRSIPAFNDSPLQFLQVTIISGQNLGLQKDVDPYVTVDVQSSDVKDQFSGGTLVIPKNGLNPHWNAKMEMHIRSFQSAVICFTVEDKQPLCSRYIGSYALPVKCLKPGISF